MINTPWVYAMQRAGEHLHQEMIITQRGWLAVAKNGWKWLAVADNDG